MANGTPQETAPTYSVPEETSHIFQNGILSNPLITPHLPPSHALYSAPITFTGNPAPSIPVNWRFAESISALKALEAVYINALLGQKYGVSPQKVVIDTDHASLFIMSATLYTIDPAGEPLSLASFTPDEKGKAAKARYEAWFPDCDFNGMVGGLYRGGATNIYKTADDRCFHIHGSLDPGKTLDMLGLPREKAVASMEEGWAPFVEKVGEKRAEELQSMVDAAKQAGTVCWSMDEYKESEHGKANAHVGLWEIEAANTHQAPSWWESPLASPSRPLAGLKVLDATRIIAAPAVGRGLAELGASVLRITAPHLPDASMLHLDLNWGKWNCSLDLRTEEGRARMKELVLEADVFVSGYRPGVMEKYGFGAEQVLEMCKGRDKGVVVVRENCYGWHGPWQGRSGWQQVSDANCGVSLEFGRAMGNDEAVTPVFPNSDYCTGVAGVCGVLEAILRRGSEGGSYKVDIALNYYSQWLVNSVGTYPSPVWDDLWTRNGRQVFRHYHGMPFTIMKYMGMLMQNSARVLFKPSFFEVRPCENLGTSIKTVAPVLRFPEGLVELGYQVGTRGNGADEARWPEDLMVQKIE